MKVLIQSRKNFYSLPGGDTIQLLKTKSELEKLGVTVDISLDYAPDLSGYDLVHLSNVTRIQETYLQVKNAKKQNKPTVLSTIYWPMDEFEKLGQIGIRKKINGLLSIDNQERIKAMARFLADKNARDEAAMNLLKIGYTSMQQYVVSNVDCYLPNSEMEMDELCKSFYLKKERYTVVPNAIDEDIAHRQLTTPIADEFMQFENAIICVGRIEPRKNQLALVKALDQSGYKLVLVGAVSNNQKGYFRRVKEVLDGNLNFYYIPRIENEKLYQLYRVCKVSTLPSWLDTPGLVSLEAAAMGCNLAISTRGSTREYFKQDAFYCEPDDLDSIRNAVVQAYSKEKDTVLQQRVLKEYTWKRAAEKTLGAYIRILTESGRSVL